MNIDGNDPDATMTVGPPTVADVSYDLGYTAEDVVQSSDEDGDPYENYGALLQAYTTGVVDTVGRIEVAEQTEKVLIRGVVLESLTPEIATLCDDHLLTRVADGDAIVEARSLVNKRVTVPISQSGGQSGNYFLSWLAGTVGKHIADAVDAAIDGLTPAAAKPLYSTFDHSTPSYIRNAGCWFDGDASGISVWNSQTNDSRKGVTAVSARHAITAHHYPVGVGATVRFVDTSGNVVTATIAGKTRAGNSDFDVVSFSEDLPGTVTPLEVLPADWNDYFAQYPIGSGDRHVVMAAIDQERNASLKAGRENASVMSGTKTWPWWKPTGDLADWWEAGVAYDSGGPLCLLIGGKLVLASTYTTPNYGYSMPYYHDDIQTAMDSLVGGYSLTDVDMSGYSDFGS